MGLRLHTDDPELLVSAVEFTAREMGLNPRLVEKDYYCSVVLEHLTAIDPSLIFKGGTCLSKVHGEFYRLSEDLDFTISTPPNATRALRSGSVEHVRVAIASIPRDLPGFGVVNPLAGANNSTQYAAIVEYSSLLDGHVERVSIEVGLRETLLLEIHRGEAMTILLDPVTGNRLLESLVVASLSYEEAMAEKVRAALCRRDPAIRDFFDVDHAVQAGRLDPIAPEFLKLVERKVAVPGTLVPSVLPERIARLSPQVDGQLRPVLRAEEYETFDLERAVTTLEAIHERLAIP